MKKQVKEWMRFSEIDLLSAKKLLEEEYLTQSVCFHCHQSIEKAMKGLLENLNERIPKIHDLEKLYGLIKEKGIEIKIDEDIMDQINDVYIDTRYPSDIGLIPEGQPSLKKAKYNHGRGWKIKCVLTWLLEQSSSLTPATVALTGQTVTAPYLGEAAQKGVILLL